jgi:hypothetical protein
MLRITAIQENQHVCLKLEGKLLEPWLDELRVSLGLSVLLPQQFRHKRRTRAHGNVLVEKFAEEAQSRHIRKRQIRQIETNPPRCILRSDKCSAQLIEPWLQQFAFKLEADMLVLLNCGNAKHERSRSLGER